MHLKTKKRMKKKPLAQANRVEVMKNVFLKCKNGVFGAKMNNR